MMATQEITNHTQPKTGQDILVNAKKCQNDAIKMRFIIWESRISNPVS